MNTNENILSSSLRQTCMFVAFTASVLIMGCSYANKSPEPIVISQPEVNPQPTPEEMAGLENANQEAELGNFTTAVQMFEDLLDENPSLTPAILGLGNVYVDMGELNKAEPTFARAARVEPGNFEAQFGHGEVLQMLGRLVESIRAYQRALSVKPDSTQVLVNMTTAYLELDMNRSAITAARRAVELSPDDGRARADLGVAYQREGLFDDAIDQYERAVEILGSDSRIVRNLVECYSAGNRFVEAVNAGEVLVRIDPSAQTWERLGRAYFRVGNYRESLKAYKNSVDLDPDYWASWNGIGVNTLNSWLIGERTDPNLLIEATEAFRKSLQLKPDQPKVIRLLTTYGS